MRHSPRSVGTVVALAFAGAIIALPLAGCVNAVMMGGMGVGVLAAAGLEMRKENRACGGAIVHMRAHLQRLDAAGGDSLPALIPGHREQVEDLLSRCAAQTNRSRRLADTTWRPLAVWLRQDVERLPLLADTELTPFMVEHRARLERFLALRESAAQAK